MNCGKRCFDSEDGTRLSCLLEKGHDGKHQGYPERFVGTAKDLAWLLMVTGPERKIETGAQ